MVILRRRAQRARAVDALRIPDEKSIHIYFCGRNVEFNYNDWDLPTHPKIPQWRKATRE